MSKEARALLKRINDMKNAIRGLQGQGKTQEMKDKMDQLREMQSEFDILMEMEDEDAAGIKDEVAAGSAKPVDGAKTGAEKSPQSRPSPAHSSTASFAAFAAVNCPKRTRPSWT